MAVAQFVERSLTIPEVCGLNPVIGKTLFTMNICLLLTVYLKNENKEKEAGNGPFFCKNLFIAFVFFFGLSEIVAPQHYFQVSLNELLSARK